MASTKIKLYVKAKGHPDHFLIILRLMKKSNYWVFVELFFVVFFICVSLTGTSQQSLSASFNSGSILVHNPQIDPLVKGPVRGFTIIYAFPNSRGEQWRPFFNYPNYGLSYNYKSYNYPEVLGNSHSFTSFLQISFLKNHSILDIGFKGFAGFGYFTKIYDPVKNPENKAISAHLNISGETRFYSKFRLEPFFLEYSFGLNHFSNGLIKAPNLGINVLNNSFSLGYEFENLPEKAQSHESLKPEPVKNELWAILCGGLKEVEGQNHKYTFSSISFNYSRQVSVINKLGIGFDFLHDPSLIDHAIKQYQYQGESNINFRYGLNLHNEFMMGKTGLFTAYGFYFGNADNYISRRFYKVGFKFYFRNLIGVLLLRAVPLFHADAVELGIGYRLK